MKTLVMMIISIVLTLMVLGFSIRQQNSIISSIEAEIASVNSAIGIQNDIANSFRNYPKSRHSAEIDEKIDNDIKKSISTLKNHTSALVKDREILARNAVLIKGSAVLIAGFFFLFAFMISRNNAKKS